MKTNLLTIFIISVCILGCSKTPDEKLVEKYNKAKILYQQNRIDEALELFESIVGTPGLSNAAVMAGKIYYFKNNYKKAEEMFVDALSSEKRNIDAMYWLAVVKRKNNANKKDVLELLDNITDLDSSNIDARLEKASIYEEDGKTDKAIKECTLASIESSKLGLVHFKLGLIYYKAELKEKAEQEFMKAMVLRPSDKTLKESISSITGK